MGETKIIRNDRGLDFRRIEQFIKMFQQKCQKKSRDIESQKSAAEKELKVKAFEHFGIMAEIEAIKSIESQIEELNKQQKVHVEKVRDYTQGQERRYNSYDDIRENSPIDQFISEGCEQFTTKRDEIWALNESLSQELWFAKNLEQAIEIMQRFQEKLDGISLEGVKVDA